jgi:HrpA-like RNA helicase
MSWGIDEKQIQDIFNFIGENAYCGIVAPTGSGKSTSLIKKLYDDGDEPRIFVSEPTVPAARGLASEMKGRLGNNIVGFAAEGVIQYSNSTKVIYCTAGHLRRKMLNYFINGKTVQMVLIFVI